jgi:hypothetical protein
MPDLIRDRINEGKILTIETYVRNPEEEKYPCSLLNTYNPDNPAEQLKFVADIRNKSSKYNPKEAIVLCKVQKLGAEKPRWISLGKRDIAELIFQFLN